MFFIFKEANCNKSGEISNNSLQNYSSFLSSSEAYSNALLQSLYASFTTYLSFLSSFEACYIFDPYFVTAINANSLSFLNSSERDAYILGDFYNPFMTTSLSS